MNEVSKFYHTDGRMDVPEGLLRSIKLPRRGTNGSAGYDFYAPRDITLVPGKSEKVCTYIKASIEPGWFLMIVPRSSLGFKYRVRLDNTAGIIDSDYYGNESNDGCIFVKISTENYSGEEIHIKAGEAFCQGIFIPYGITADDDPVSVVRIGGIGSTSPTIPEKPELSE